MAIEDTLLCMGCETEASIDSLLSFTKLTSEGIRKAFIYHYVRGMEEDLAITISGVKTQNFSRDRKILVEVARKISAHNELKYIS